MAALFTTVTVNMTTALRQLCKQQDFAASGNGELFNWMVVLDGHGGNKVTNTIVALNPTIDWYSVLNHDTAPEIYNAIQSHYSKLGSTKGFGATFVAAKIYPTHYDLYWAGDSPAWIFENNHSVFSSEIHNELNKTELARLEALPQQVLIHPTKKIQKRGENIIEQIPSSYFAFGPRDNISISHSLGHQEITGKFLQHHRFTKTPGKQYKLLLCSDGLSDLFEPQTIPGDLELIARDDLTADILADFAEAAWKKQWTFKAAGYADSPAYFPPDGYDDVAVALLVEDS